MSESMFPDVYKEIQPGSLTAIHADVLKKQKYILQSVCPGPGLINYAIQSYINSLCCELAELGITGYTPENRDRLIEIIRLRARARTYRPAGGPNDAGATQGVCPPRADAADVPADVHQTNPGGGGLGRAPGSKTGKGKKKPVKAQEGLGV